MKQYIINLLFVKSIHMNVCNRKKRQLMYEYEKYYITLKFITHSQGIRMIFYGVLNY